jgi:hypothetical protein
LESGREGTALICVWCESRSGSPPPSDNLKARSFGQALSTGPLVRPRLLSPCQMTALPMEVSLAQLYTLEFGWDWAEIAQLSYVPWRCVLVSSHHAEHLTAHTHTFNTNSLGVAFSFFCITYLSLLCNFCVHTAKDGCSCLLFACQNGHLEIVRTSFKCIVSLHVCACSGVHNIRLSPMRKTTFEPIFTKKIFGCAEDLLRTSGMLGSGPVEEMAGLFFCLCKSHS